jgi:hypothetical protein
MCFNLKKKHLFYLIKMLNALLCILINTTCRPRHNVSLNTSIFTRFSTCFQHVLNEPSHRQEVQFYRSKHAQMLRGFLLDILKLKCIYKIKRQSKLLQSSCLVRSEGLTEMQVNIHGILYKMPCRYDKRTKVSEKRASSIFKVVYSLSQI